MFISVFEAEGYVGRLNNCGQNASNARPDTHHCYNRGL